jgi:hypothetical protein
LTSVAKVPLPPEALLIGEADFEPHELSRLGWLGLRASLKMKRGSESRSLVRGGTAKAVRRLLMRLLCILSVRDMPEHARWIRDI